MRTMSAAGWIGVACVLAGCGGSALEVSKGAGLASPQSVARADARPAAPSSMGPATSDDAPSGSADASDFTGPHESARSESAPRRERPGLGTEWGETRSSRVHDVRFTRADGDRPFAVATVHYDDDQGVAQAARGRAGSVAELDVADGAVTVGIRGESGDPLDARFVADRTYVVGREGQRYSIVVTNHTSHRFETVATVDGLDVVNGRAGALSNRGYVLPAFGSVTIDGFRQSREAVAAFRFSRVSESYAARTGSDRNVGVIGVALFSERGDAFDPLRERETARREHAEPFPADPRFARPPR